MARATLRAFFLAFCLLGIWAPRSASAWHSNVTNPNNTSLLFPNKNYTFLTINDPLYGVRNVSYWEAFDGLAIIDGDVLYGTVEELLSHKVTGQEPLARRAHSIFRTVNPWASATVTYQFSNAATQTLVGSIVNSAIANWKATAPYLSFKRIADSATAQNGVVQINAVPCGGCFSSKIGFYNIPLVMNLQQSCGTSTSSCGVAQATHEFGHILGLYHEHQRADREKFVHYNCANLNPVCTNMPPGTTCCSSSIPAGCCPQAGNFTLLSGPNFDFSGPYDINSIMQYPNFAFGIAGTNTLTSAAKGIVVPVSVPGTIDTADSNRVCKVYASRCPKAQACTAARCPSTCVPVNHCTKIGICDNPKTAPPCCHPVSAQTCNREKAACTAKGCDFLKN